MNRIDEDRLFEAYAEQIAVPEMWENVRRRIEADSRRRPRRVFWLAAAAAALIAVVMFVPRQDVPAPPVVTAASKYESACRSLESRLRTAAPLLPELTQAVALAEAAARRSPDDPVAVSSLISAYDAKLQYLIGAVHDQS